MPPVHKAYLYKGRWYCLPCGEAIIAHQSGGSVLDDKLYPQGPRDLQSEFKCQKCKKDIE